MTEKKETIRRRFYNFLHKKANIAKVDASCIIVLHGEVPTLIGQSDIYLCSRIQ